MHPCNVIPCNTINYLIRCQNERYITIENIDGCKNNAENLSTSKVSEHLPSCFSMFTISSLKSMENVYRGKDCMKKFCVYLKTHAMKIISFQKEEDKVMNKRRAAII